jgi:hypothetical protein
MSARHRQAKKRLAELEIERDVLAQIEKAYRVVREHIQLSTAQSVAQAHADVSAALTDLDRRVVDARSALDAMPKRWQEGQ